MNRIVVQRILGLLLMMFSVTMLPPIVVSLIYGDGGWLSFVEGLLINLAAGLFPLAARPRCEGRSQAAGRLPGGGLILAGSGHLRCRTAVFRRSADDVVHGRGVRIHVRPHDDGRDDTDGLDALPESILWYRQQLQWLGGMGIIVLAVAILPMLGVGGMQLYRAETPGPIKDTKLTPRITETAKALWYLYLGFTIICAASYWAAGMSVFDALCHSFSTVAIGGFSTHDLSIGHFQSTAINLIAIVFMFLAGINFSLHFFAWRYSSIAHYFKDPEFRAYSFILMMLVATVVVVLALRGTYENPLQAMEHGLFQAVSIATTTGYTTANYSAWPGALPVLLIFASFVGGCAGSTAGGMKVIRWLLIYKQGVREIARLVHPSAEIPVKLGPRAVQARVIEAVWGFFSVYVVVFAVMMMLMLSTGLDQVTAFSAVAAVLNNLGPGLGDVASGFMTVPTLGKWVAILAMVMGRLEIFTLLVLMTPIFWRR